MGQALQFLRDANYLGNRIGTNVTPKLSGSMVRVDYTHVGQPTVAVEYDGTSYRVSEISPTSDQEKILLATGSWAEVVALVVQRFQVSNLTGSLQ